MASVQFILGRSGTGKSRWCTDAVCQALKVSYPLRGTGPLQGESLKDPLILLVPEQATYQVERSILSHPNITGFSRLHVLSFNRLGFWLQSGQSPAVEVSRTGKQMILHKLLLEHAEKLSLYKSGVGRMGLAEKFSGLLDELQHSGCGAKQIADLAEGLAHKPDQMLAARKWSDIAMIFATYESYFAERGVSNPDTELTDIKELVAKADFLKGARLWVDGFSGFSIQERNLLIELLKVCNESSIALCLDPTAIDLANTDEDALNPCSLFASTEQTYCELLRIVKNCKLPIVEPVIFDTPLRFSNVPALASLEANLLLDNTPTPVSADGAVQVAACGNIRAEIMWVAGQIRKLVKDIGYRYRDIAVVVPELGAYQHYIESAFSQYTLPYFLDRPRRMKTHPLTELVGSALQAATGGFALSDVLGYLKSPLMTTPIEQIDALENYCRAYDVQTAEWLKKGGWDFAPKEEKDTRNESELDLLRREVIAPLKALQKAIMTDEMISAEQFVKAVWTLLDTLGAGDRLGEWAAEDVTDQQFGHRQVFSRLVGLMDELCEIFAGVELSAQVWGSIFTDALSSMTVKLIPPTLDQVLVGSIERSRHPDIKAIFLVGAVQKQFPVPVMGEMLLTEQDYQSAAELELANPYLQNLTHRPYLTYIALTRASRQVSISYPLNDEKGTAIVPWSGVDQLAAWFSDVEIQHPAAGIKGVEDIQSPHPLAQWLSGQLGKDRLPEALTDEIAAGILKRMEESKDESLNRIAALVQKSLEYNNAAVLDGELAQQMFAFPVTTSASRLGTFAKCPYQYFAKYTLGLEPRQTLKFEPMDVGKFYHAVLEAVFKALKKQGKDWADLSGDELIAVCDAESERIISQDTQLSNFIRRRAHHRYIIQSAREVLRSLVPMLAQLSNAGQFKQAEAELRFGFDESLRLVLPLDDRRNIYLRGLIDRLDIADVDGKKTAVVFDYKSGGKSVDFAGMLYGLDLQLPIYLLAVKGQGMTPAGAFFLAINSGIPSASPSDIDTIQAAFNKAKGLFDGRFFKAMDTQAATSGGWSEFFNYYVNKEGDPYGHYKTSGALKPEDFQTLLDHTERCVKKLIADLAAGCIRIAPYRIGTCSPCSWCDYRAVCRFDWQINDYNFLDTVGKEQALNKMRP